MFACYVYRVGSALAGSICYKIKVIIIVCTIWWEINSRFAHAGMLITHNEILNMFIGWVNLAS